jgi:hypothetical protein
MPYNSKNLQSFYYSRYFTHKKVLSHAALISVPNNMANAQKRKTPAQSTKRVPPSTKKVVKISKPVHRVKYGTGAYARRSYGSRGDMAYSGPR